MRPMRRATLAVTLTALVAMACSDGADPGGASDADAPVDPDPETSAGTPPATAPDREPIREVSEGCEEGVFHWDQPGCQPATMIELERIVSGGPPPDGIPPIDEPSSVSATSATGSTEYRPGCSASRS